MGSRPREFCNHRCGCPRLGAGLLSDWRLSVCGGNLAGRKGDGWAVVYGDCRRERGVCPPQPVFHCVPLRHRQGPYAFGVPPCLRLRGVKARCGSRLWSKKNVVSPSLAASCPYSPLAALDIAASGRQPVGLYLSYRRESGPSERFRKESRRRPISARRGRAEQNTSTLAISRVGRGLCRDEPIWDVRLCRWIRQHA